MATATTEYSPRRCSLREDVRDFKAKLLGQVQKPPQIDIYAADALQVRLACRFSTQARKQPST
jgi:hypothetical protein